MDKNNKLQLELNTKEKEIKKLSEKINKLENESILLSTEKNELVEKLKILEENRQSPDKNININNNNILSNLSKIES